MRQKKYVITLLVLLALVVSGFTYAYWAGGVDAASITDQTANITIGQGTTVTTSAVVNDTSGARLPLVPSGREEVGVTTHTVTVTYTVAWTNDGGDAVSAAGATATLTVNPTLSLTGLAQPRVNVLFDITSVTITGGAAADGEITFGETKTVTIVITFVQEPADFDEYELVANKDLILTVALALTSVTPA